MQNGNHYVAVRMTQEEKARFVRIAKLCILSEKALYYRLMDDRPIRERPQEQFGVLDRLLLHVILNADTFRICRNLPAEYRKKYEVIGRELNMRYCIIQRKLLYAEPDYGNDYYNLIPKLR